MAGSSRDGTTDGRKRRWQQHNAERRAAVIDAALTVLSRESEPGADISVQQIADESGVHRTVLYRYFEDRTDLDLAIQREICRRAGDVLLSTTTLEGTVKEIIHRVIGSYVTWGSDNIALLRFAEKQVNGTTERPLDDAIGQFAEQVELLIGGIIALLDVEITDNDQDALAPWVFLLVGGVMAAVRSWTSRDELRPDTSTFIDLLAEVTWLQIDGLVTSRNIVLPDLPIEQLLTFTDAKES
ncbi:TetR/AcrR family transcriptional regulator [Nocardioides caeni]|uniref:TetR/AcrR family transcriptional regulator n=1 Tax=Nocardioides caeni TaxID=574700 RepID=A0A4S8N0N1_9ACTN|nr:TetR/AcrR family transcriptional regulator [Nocardioides caeni]THV09313.1 TetR/AcrR family transcriptional regulator [Nocardioides caeni]